MIYFIIILISLLLSAFFSGMEIAFVSANKLKIELDKKQKTNSSRLITFFTSNPSSYIATMLIGNNIALVIYGIVMAIVLEPFIALFTSSGAVILIIQTIISTLIILITAEFLPKTIFRINSNFALKFFAIPVFFFYVIFYPLTLLSVSLSNNFLKTLFNINIKKSNPKTAFGKADLDDLVHSSEKENQEIDNELKIFQKALDFSNIKLRECIVPRTEITAIEINEEIEILKHKFIETGFSKILIFKESIDNIIGYANSSELFKNPQSIKAMMHNIMIVPETMPANKLLSDFINENKSLAVVVDEFGGTSGMVTIEDIIEEITGEIEDEHDTSELTERKVNENEYLFSGRLEIDYVNDKYNLNIPTSEEYETIAGFILAYHENIPKLNETIIIGELGSVKILEVSKTRIELICLKLIVDS